MVVALVARLADVRCPVCDRRWHRAETSPQPIIIEAKCASARCHGALRTVRWQDGRAILIENETSPDATERGGPSCTPSVCR